jgi:hypothetical protein
MRSGSHAGRRVAGRIAGDPEEADVSLDQIALMLYAVVEGSSGRTSVVAVLAAMAVVEVGVMLVLKRVFRSDGGDGEDPGGEGWGRGRGPREPPPEDPDSWPEFERRFAEHVAALGERERPSSRARPRRE